MWHHCITMEFQKIANFLDTTSADKDLPRLLLIKEIKVLHLKTMHHLLIAFQKLMA